MVTKKEKESQRIEKYLIKKGFEKENAILYPFRLMTARAGLMLVSARYEYSPRLKWYYVLFCRFDDVEKAKEIFKHDSDFNTHSGKHNPKCLMESFEDFKLELEYRLNEAK